MNARIAKTVATLAAAGGLLLGLSACSSVVSSSDVQTKVSDAVYSQTQARPDSVSCPDDLKAEVGATLTCNVVFPDERFDVVAKVTSVDGSTVNFDIDKA
jgi:hypothetical protein